VVIILALVGTVVCFFGLMGYLLFADSSTILHVPYFLSLSNSLYNMLLIQTSLPTLVPVMKPYFHHTEWNGLYFVVFVLLTNFFLVKLTIAVSYRTYKRNTEKMLFKRLQKRKVALQKAFTLLAEAPHEPRSDSIDDENPITIAFEPRDVSSTSSHHEGKEHHYLSIKAWVAICQYLKPRWSAEEAQVIFLSVSPNGQSVILPEFIQLCSILVNASVSKQSQHRYEGRTGYDRRI
jgi:hypothetical protein